MEYDAGAAFGRIEDILIDSMMRNLRRHLNEESDLGFDWSQWQVEQLKYLDEYRKNNPEQFDRQFREINSRITEALEHAYENGQKEEELRILEALANNKRIQRQAAQAAIQGAGDAFFRVNEDKLGALIKAAHSDMERAEAAVLRRANDQYRKIIFDAQVYANTGAGTIEQAVDMATKDFLMRGIDCIEYKNGARHTIADYADMYIKTAERRAYLAGEGKKRQEWGESLVIVNKRGGHPCPHCVKWVGKILIDDVYSGGEPDGKHQLLSEAMAQGFLHPRCRDGFTTYFPGVTTVPDPAEEQEIRAGAEAEQQEAREQYAGRMAERWDRRAKYSLDPGNKRQAEARATEWRDSVANGGDSDIIKNISLEDFQKVNDGRVEDGIIQCVYDAMQEFNSTNLFHSAKVVETYKNVAFQTDVVRVGTFADVVLNINSNFFGDLSLAEANNMFNNAASTVCNSVRDGVVHEIYHAKLVMGRNFSQIEALYDELSDIHISGISPTAMQDGTELIAEIGVLIERGEYDSVPEEAKIIFEKYLGG